MTKATTFLALPAASAAATSSGCKEGARSGSGSTAKSEKTRPTCDFATRSWKVKSSDVPIGNCTAARAHTGES